MPGHHGRSFLVRPSHDPRRVPGRQQTLGQLTNRYKSDDSRTTDYRRLFRSRHWETQEGQSHTLLRRDEAEPRGRVRVKHRSFSPASRRVGIIWPTRTLLHDNPRLASFQRARTERSHSVSTSSRLSCRQRLSAVLPGPCRPADRSRRLPHARIKWFLNAYFALAKST